MATVTEFEVRVLGVDPAAMAGRIAAVGGRHVADRLMRRYVYDVEPGRWIRLRDTGAEVTLCVKEITSDAIGGTLETEVVVGGFEETHAVLGRMGFVAKAYQENRRASWLLDGVRLEIDAWPLIPPYLEIEGDDADAVRAAAHRLGLTEGELTGANTTALYAAHGIDLDTVADLRFP